MFFRKRNGEGRTGEQDCKKLNKKQKEPETADQPEKSREP